MCYTVRYGRKDREAGIQVPLLPDRRAGRYSCSHVRLRPLRLQPGTGRAVPRLDPGAPPGYSRRHRQDAHAVEARPRDSLAVRAVQGSVASDAAEPTGRVRLVLAQADPVPDVQEEGQDERLRHLLLELLHLPGRSGEVGEDVGDP